MRTKMVALALAAALTASCDSIFGSADPCSTDIAPTFERGRDLEISWPSCTLVRLEVYNHQDNRMWSLRGEFEPPVIYGIIPQGGSETGPAFPLVPGAQYKLFLGVEGDDELVFVGPFQFTR